MVCLKCGSDILSPTRERYGLHTRCFSDWFHVPAKAFFINLQRKSSSSDISLEAIARDHGSFFQGKFKKYSAELKGHPYIFKMRDNKAPELPEVEYLCNQIGVELGIPVARFYCIHFNGENTFVTKNFIQSGRLTDLQHLCHFRTDDQHNVTKLIEIISKETQQPSDVVIFVNILLFDALIGNHDRHGRNLAFIVESKKKILSPIYDNVSYLSLEHGAMLNADFNPTGRIATSKTNEPNMRDYAQELMRLGFGLAVKTFYEKIDLSNLNKLIKNSFCSQLMKQAITKLIKKRYEELKNVLSSEA